MNCQGQNCPNKAKWRVLENQVVNSFAACDTCKEAIEKLFPVSPSIKIVPLKKGDKCPPDPHMGSHRVNRF